MVINHTASFLTTLSAQLENKKSRTHLALLWFAILFGLFLRVYFATIGQAYHHFAINDEISAYWFLLSYLENDPAAQYLAQPTFGQGQLPGPLWTWFSVALYKLGGSTLSGAVICMAIFNSLAIYLLYRLAIKLVSAKYALIATLLFSAGSWPVYYSAGLWNPMPLVVIGTLMLLLLWHVTTTDNSKLIVLLAVVFAAIPQFHMIGIFYLPAVLLVLYLGKASINKGWLVAGILCGFLIYLPYLVHDAANNWDNTHKMAAGAAKETKPGVAKIISAPVTLLSNAPGRWTGESEQEHEQFASAMFGNINVLITVAVLSLLSAIVYLARFMQLFFSHVFRSRKSLHTAYHSQPELMFIGIMLCLPLLFFSLTGQNYSTRYALIILPLLFLMPVLFYKDILSGKWKKFWQLNISIQAIIGVYLLFALFSYQHNSLEKSDRFIASFSMLETISDLLRKDAGQGHPVRIGLAADINKLDETHRKVYRVIDEYMATRQKFLEDVDNRLQPVDYLVTQSLQPAEAMHIAYKVVYADNGMYIMRKQP